MSEASWARRRERALNRIHRRPFVSYYAWLNFCVVRVLGVFDGDTLDDFRDGYLILESARTGQKGRLVRPPLERLTPDELERFHKGEFAAACKRPQPRALPPLRAGNPASLDPDPASRAQRSAFITRWLKDLLASGPLPEIEIRRQAADSKIARNPLDRAKKRLKVTSHKRGGWYWQLPETPSSPQGPLPNAKITEDL